MVQKRKIWLPLWLILGLGLAFLLRLPSLFEPYSYGDECIYLTLGQAIRKGLILYRDIYDNKPPLLYLLAAISGNLFRFRLLLLIWSLITIFSFFKLAKILFPKKEKIVQFSTLIFAFFSSIPWFEAGVANAEVFMLLPIFAGIILIFCGKKLSLLRCFLAGILFSLATLFKVPAAFDFVAVLVFLILFGGIKEKNYPTFAKATAGKQLLITNYLLLFLGFSLPILLTFFYFWSQGALNQYLTAAFLQNLPYLSSWGGNVQTGPLSQELLLRFLITFAFLCLVFWKKKGINPSSLFLFSWFVLSLFAATLSSRPYPHYLVQVLPSLSLLFGLLFSKLNSREHLFVSISLASFLFAVFYFQFWFYPIFSPYKNFFLFLSRKWSQEQYFASFGKKVSQNYKLAEFIVSHTKENEKIFVWGDSPCVYALSRRLPAGRYTASYHIADFNGYQEASLAIQKEKPRFIIDLQDEEKQFSKLRELILQKYSLFGKINGAEVFRRASSKMI